MAPATPSGEVLALHVDAMAVGGDGVARDDGGRVVFVRGALPGEDVRAMVESERPRFAHAVATEVVAGSADRVAPVCPHVARGCGGCGWAHVDPAAQRRFKAGMVAEALHGIGRLSEPLVEEGPQLATSGFRTTVRAALVGGRAAFRTAHGHERVTVDSCRVTHPLVEEILVDGRFGAADEVTVRAGVATGDRLVVVHPSVDPSTSVPDDVVVVGADELAGGRRVWIHEEVADVRLRVSAESFFQSRPDGAAALVEEVGRGLAGVSSDAPLADLYCGVGLFAATVGAGRPVVAVERSRSSVADARVNLDGADARVVRSAVERWRPSASDAVVADPARRGLAQPGVERIAATGARRLVLVSCDAGSLGRDAALLCGSGWSHDRSTLVDLFIDTPHVEVVSVFSR